MSCEERQSKKKQNLGPREEALAGAQWCVSSFSGRGARQASRHSITMHTLHTHASRRRGNALSQRRFPESDIKGPFTNTHLTHTRPCTYLSAW